MTETFYEDLRRHDDFGDLCETGAYVPLPDDWWIGTADIVNSTQEIASGRYKTVNMVAAAVISALMNGAKDQTFPFVFGGDGVGFAVPPTLRDTAQAALAAVRVWADAEFSIALRTALMPMQDVRTHGADVAVARYRAAPAVDYAMFTGGGLALCERLMKEGALDVPDAPSGTEPDLTGLSCRWAHMSSRNGTILSVVLQPEPGASEADIARLVAEIVACTGRLARAGHPAPDTGPGTNWPPAGATLEAHARRTGASLSKARRAVLIESGIAWVLMRLGLVIGGFDPKHYGRTVAANSDFRKFDDGLKMTLDCDEATRAKLTGLLGRGQAAGLIRYGLWAQTEAMMTCIVPSFMQDDHIHFIDGASGGYTQAAAQMKGS
ncbi:MAG: DUF3095 domain-containing protein [Pseudomonadota bacterium]